MDGSGEDEVRQEAKTQTQQALENLSLQVGSERAWRMAFEMELRWRKAEARVVELRREIRRLEVRRSGRRVREQSSFPGVVVQAKRKRKRKKVEGKR